MFYSAAPELVNVAYFTYRALPSNINFSASHILSYVSCKCKYSVSHSCWLKVVLVCVYEIHFV